jgi:5-(carboxyamino)imidazole ribonucleotide mutase
MTAIQRWKMQQLKACKLFKEWAIPFEITVSSAHRSPDRTHRYAVTLEERGVQVVIACAGAAAHLVEPREPS